MKSVRGEGAPRMVSMRLGCVVSFLGVALVLGSTLYYITLPAGTPIKEFFDTNFLGLPYLLYFAIIGSAITVVGLVIFIKASRSVEAVAQPGRIMARQRGTGARIRTVRPRGRERARIEGGGIVEEIEREIEEIVKSSEEIMEETGVEEEVEEVREEEVKPEEAVEVVTRGTDMVCPNCGAINPLKSKKCSKCKKPLFKAEKGEPTCPTCGAPLKLAKRISDELFVCGLCFSELKIPTSLQEEIGLT
ncbi:MAG: hypothetical protein DRN47_03840 [Candidatus Wolframiiraptor sp.]|nr:MAG: hypothetical protein DRN47_03840 [Candidatus Wolframiiraptor sp.]